MLNVVGAKYSALVLSISIHRYDKVKKKEIKRAKLQLIKV
jgi:hypothetical protein